jgi:hypothetical protein
LCLSEETTLFFTSTQKNLERDYYHCEDCDLVFVPPEFHLDPEAEKARYLTHNNDPNDVDYRAFLARLWDELRPRLTVGVHGLDYGAGPGPALAAMIEEAGFSVALYDPFFHPNTAALSISYDFITCTETVEHFSSPRTDFVRLHELLKPGGWLGVMTGVLKDKINFADWYYQRDPTHVAFYSEGTLRWVADWLRWEVEFPRANIALFQKPDGGRSEQGLSVFSNCHSEALRGI